MSGNEAAAIARLEVQVSHLLDAAKKRDEAMEDMAQKLDAIQSKLDQSAGGIAVLRWLGLGSLGSALAVCAAVYGYLKSH